MAAAYIGLIVVFLQMALPAHAGNFKVSPLRLDLSPAAGMGAIEVANTGDAPLTIQVKAFKWLQSDAGDFSYEPTDNVVVFPKLLTINPGQPATLRVGFRGGLGAREDFYRLLIKEVITDVPAADAGDEKTVASFKVALQLSVPVVVRAMGMDKAPVLAGIESLEVVAGQLKLGVRNNGETSFQVGKIMFDLLGDDGTALGTLETTGSYVLPGKRSYFSMAVDKAICPKLGKAKVAMVVGKAQVEKEVAIASRDCTVPPMPHKRAPAPAKP